VVSYDFMTLVLHLDYSQQKTNTMRRYKKISFSD